MVRTDNLGRYADRIDRAVALLERTLPGGEAPDLETLSGAAALSPYHFHRVFRLMTGETVNAMVRRLRLARGSAELDGGSITDASGAAGYASTQAFARAMRSATGLSASEARRTGAREAIFRAPINGAPLAIEMVTADPFELIVIRNIDDYAALNSAYGRLFEIAGGPDTVTGIWAAHRGDALYDAALTVSDMPADPGEARRETWEGGTHLRMRHHGDYDLVPGMLDAMTLDAMAQDHVSLRHAPVMVHYLDDPEEVAEDRLRADLYLPIEG